MSRKGSIMLRYIDRRELLIGAGATLISLRSGVAVTGGSASIPPAPVARIQVVKDTYFGETLQDPYRWMENDKDPEWLPFLKGQNDHTRGVLKSIPGHDALLGRIRQLSGDTATTRATQRAGNRLFFEQRPTGAENFKLFVREAGKIRILIDPTALGQASGAGHFSLDWWSASPDGSHLVYGLSKDGSEDSVLHVMQVADARDLPERIPNTESAQPQWLDDGTGFFYNQLTGAIGTPERYLDSVARFHRLGADPAADPVISKRGMSGSVAYERIQMPHIRTFFGSRHVLLILSDVRQEARMLVAPVADVVSGKAHWVHIAGFEDEVTDVEVDGDTIYLLANKGAPRGRILHTSTVSPSLSAATEVVPQSARVIESISLAKDGLYLRIMDGGISRLQRLRRDGRLEEIALPFDGTISALETERTQDGAMFAFQGWLTASDIWASDAQGHVQPTDLTPKPAIDVSSYETVRSFATAKDGTKIPYSLIYKKGIKLDGSNPAWISAYGSYGIPAYTPAFAGRSLALIDAGFIVGYANVRGGGEYGRGWHKAGQLANKPNTWRDLIAVCEELCAKKYTAPARLAIGGRSAGGITVGRAMTERPDLFAAVIDGVGWSNPLRYVAEQNGYGEEPEWGAISEESGYRALKSIDSYQAVRDGVRYPAVLLTTGVTDPRVAPFHVAKMAARLQAASKSGKPILLRVDYDAGHGIGSTRVQQDQEAADTYAFLLWQTGVAGYQPG
jgi:prolyl oligopeptidase